MSNPFFEREINDQIEHYRKRLVDHAIANNREGIEKAAICINVYEDALRIYRGAIKI